MKTLAVVAVMLLAGLTAQAQNRADDILGTWWNAEKTSKIEVYKNGNKYFGKIIHLETPNDDQGKPRVDKDNPDAKLRNRPLMGLVILKGLEYDEDGEFEDGEIYDPKSGKTYSANAKLVGKDKLDLRGYVGISLIGRTSTWTRAK
ncbi:hypothetical protein D770_04495 [Flammeovirgaceae bacterium 311]|nr:hypothetical protein D770_04495 [Flammeovirgaceae bacterium 311]